MKSFTARSRITVGLVCLLFSVVCLSMMLGLVPERRSALLRGRADLCEAIAITCSDYANRGELQRLEQYVESIVEREEDVLSIGIRRADGELITSSGEHAGHWTLDSTERSTDAQILVPIRSGVERWGAVEVRFEPLLGGGKWGWVSGNWARLVVFISGACYVAFYLYLGKMLAHLDPSKSVPKRVRSALDSLAEGLLVIDRTGRIVLANQSFATWVGIEGERLVGFHASKLQWVQDESGAAVTEFPWQLAIEQEMALAGSMLGIRCQDETIRILIANASPVLGHDGKYRGVLVSFDDVTLLEETKRDLRLAKRNADEANQAKSEFLARMSHEIRTPMNAILGYTDVLRRGFDEDAESRQEYLETIHVSGEHLLALINDILDLSKVESGQLELELERCAPHHLIQQVATLLKSKSDEKGIDFDLKYEGLLPETISTDQVRLRQVLMNLAGNAIKFTSEGSVTVVARMETESDRCWDRIDEKPERAWLAFDVIDTGIGIAYEDQAKIFEPFAQADTSITRRFGGTGLGLAISKQLCEAMGGEVRVQSQPGRGTTFTVTMEIGSLDGVRLVHGQLAASDKARRSEVKEDVERLPGARILVADDGESNRKLVKLVLTRAGAEVVTVENGRLAVDQVMQSEFDVVLMDMQMPVMDGYSATRLLRSEGYDLPVIALTANAMHGDEEKCLEAGCSGFMTKPIKIDKLLSELSGVLRERQPADSMTYEPPQSTRPAVTSAGPEAIGAVVERPVSNAIPVNEPVAEESAADEPDTNEPVLSEEAVSDEALSDETVIADNERVTEPLLSSLPIEDPDFREIVEEFVQRLDTKVQAMRDAYRANDFSELAALAHWLKGSGGTAGFDCLTESAQRLEQVAKGQDPVLALAGIEEVSDLAGRIVVPAAT